MSAAVQSRVGQRASGPRAPGKGTRPGMRKGKDQALIDGVASVRGRGPGRPQPATVPEMAAERDEEPGSGPCCLCPGTAAGKRGMAGGCRCSALPAPRQGVMEEARRRLRQFDVGDKFSRLPLPRAAVLLPLMVRGDRLHLLLTVRSMQVPGSSEGRGPSRQTTGVRSPGICAPPVPALVLKGTARCFLHSWDSGACVPGTCQLPGNP